MYNHKAAVWRPSWNSIWRSCDVINNAIIWFGVPKNLGEATWISLLCGLEPKLWGKTCYLAWARRRPYWIQDGGRQGAQGRCHPSNNKIIYNNLSVWQMWCLKGNISTCEGLSNTGGIFFGGHLEIQYGGHVTSSAMVSFNSPTLKT